MSHLHNIYDTDLHFVINPSTRSIGNNSGKTTLVQHDHNSERFTFEIPRMIDGHDMSLCDLVEIHYLNTSSTSQSTNNPGVYIVDDLQLSPDSDDVVIFSWLVSGNATKYVGKLDFNIRFLCDDGDGKPEYVWNTATHTGVVIISSIYNGDVVAEEYADVLAEWDARLKVLEEANADIDTEQDISLDVPLVADYVQGEEAYLYPSGMVNTRNLNWHRDIKLDQWSDYNKQYVYGRERIVKVKTDNVIQARNGYYLKKIADDSVIQSVTDCQINVWEQPNHNILKPIDKAETTHNGVTYSFSDGVIYITDSGDEKTATAQVYTNLEEPIAAGTYTYNLTFDSGIGGDNPEFSLGIGLYNEAGSKIGSKTIWSYNGTDTIELTDTAVQIIVTSNSSNVLNNVVMRLEIMSGSGSVEDKNILIIGDSYTAERKWVEYFKADHLNALENYKLIEGNSSVGFEATGGYTWNNYVEDKANLPSGYNGNPFWIGGKLDIKAYVESKLGTGASLDYLICMLGINTWVNGKYRDEMYNTDIDTAINSIKTLAPQLFEAVHTAYSDCKILICGYPLPPFIDGVNNSKWEVNLFERADFLHRLNQTYTDFATQYDYVRFVHMSSSVDSTKAFNVGEAEINNATYQMLTTDDIHPADIGYHQIADAVWRGFVGLTNM